MVGSKTTTVTKTQYLSSRSLKSSVVVLNLAPHYNHLGYFLKIPMSRPYPNQLNPKSLGAGPKNLYFFLSCSVDSKVQPEKNTPFSEKEKGVKTSL